MKPFLLSLLVICSFNVNGQTLLEMDKKLSQAYAKIEYWYSYNREDSNISGYDSLEKANTDFEKLLLNYTSTDPKTLSYPFKNLSDSGLTIHSSEDSLFRIYSWNTLMGGTMRFFKNVFQYRNSKGTFSTVPSYSPTGDYSDPGCFYRQINSIHVQNKTYYIAQNIFIGSSALSYHRVKIFSIEPYGLNDTAKLIKTRTGIRNELGYEVDFSLIVNRNFPRPDVNYSTGYDPALKIITIPLIEGDGKLTNRKIRYRFDGRYFVKM